VRSTGQNLPVSFTSSDPPDGCGTRSACAEVAADFSRRGRVGSMKRQAEPCADTLMGSSLAPREPNSAQCAHVGLPEILIGARVAAETSLTRVKPICWRWPKTETA
jgi:hypothetical protein